MLIQVAAVWECRRYLSRLLRSIVQDQRRILIERNGDRIAALIHINDYDKLVEYERKEKRREVSP